MGHPYPINLKGKPLVRKTPPIEMPYVQHFPHVFAVVRSQAIRGPSLQILQASERNRYYYISNDPNSPRFLGIGLHRIARDQIDRTIYTLRYKTDEFSQVNEVKFWALPYYIQDRDWEERIPLVEFQYRSWIPGNYDAIPMSPIQAPEVLDSIERLQEERLLEIRESEDSNSRAFYDNSYDSYMGNPPFRNLLMRSGPDDYDDRRRGRRGSFVGVGYYDRPNTPPSRFHQPDVRVVERVVEVPVERVVTQVRIQPLPKAVGDILLANARAGSDSCPILAIPFKECEKICVSSCFHIFDKESLARWQTTNSNCPVCRSKIENIVSE
jgi:hypothetical protein